MIPSPKVSSRQNRRIAKLTSFALASVFVMAPIVTTPAKAAGIPAICKKITTEVVNADKVYTALQYGVVQAAKAYVANENLTNRLNYNDS